MTPRQQENNFQDKLIDSIQFIGLNNKPNGWLPEPVTVVEAVEDPDGEERPNLLHCILNEICDDRSCYMNVVGSEEEEEDVYGLCEITNISHIKLWEKYVNTSDDVWRDNAIAYLSKKSEASEDTIRNFVDTCWNREELFGDNLDAFNRFLNDGNEREQFVFTYSIDRFDRNIDDSEIIADYEKGHSSEPTRKYMLDEFAELINDEMFDDVHNWVRIIELPKDV